MDRMKSQVWLRIKIVWQVLHVVFILLEMFFTGFFTFSAFVLIALAQCYNFYEIWVVWKLFKHIRLRGETQSEA